MRVCMGTSLWPCVRLALADPAQELLTLATICAIVKAQYAPHTPLSSAVFSIEQLQNNIISDIHSA